MKFLILLSTVVLTRTTPVPENCNGIKVNNSPVLYEREVLKSGLYIPTSLTVDHSTNILYFTYNTDERTYDERTRISAKIDLNDKKFKNITGVPEAYALTMDSKTNEVYISGADGIYKYNPKIDTPELYAATDVKVRSLCFHDYLYYTVSPPGYVRVVKNGKSVRAADIEAKTVGDLLIDKDGYIFYTNYTGVYGQKKGIKDSELYKKFDVKSVSFFMSDKNGQVYVAMDDGIYVVNKDEKRLDYLFQIQEYYSIAFDKDNNILYSDDYNIYILKPNKSLTC